MMVVVRRFFSLAIALFFAFSQPLAIGAVQSRVVSDPAIGPRDILGITVFNEPTMSMDVVVSASGEFSFPLLRRVEAAGKTLDELGLHMEKRLREGRYLIEPSVTIRFVEQNFFIVTLTGAVKEPGVIPIYPGFRLRRLVAQQGGILDAEAGPFIHVQRASGEQLTVPRDDLENGNSDEMSRANVELMPGDDIVVPNADDFYVLGAVNQPGGFPLTRSTTLGEALGMAGGRAPKGGNTLLWHRHRKNEEPLLVTFTYAEYQENPTIRNSSVGVGDSLYVTQNDFIFVGGKVLKPGTYPWEPDMTVLSAVVTAGDREFTAGQSIVLVREGSDGKQFKIKLKHSDIKKNREKDVNVLPGDIIYVSANPLLNVPYAIKRINPFSTAMSLFSGGVLD